MNKTYIINIYGKAQHGKDTLAVLLLSELVMLGYTGQIVWFATDLKRMAKKQGWDGKKDKEGRTFLQNLGQEKRKKDKDYWVKRAEKQFKDVDFILIADTRYMNEIEYFKRNDYQSTTIKIIRLNSNRDEYQNNLTEKQRKHSSEIELENYDFDYVCKCKSRYEIKINANIIARSLNKKLKKESAINGD